MSSKPQTKTTEDFRGLFHLCAPRGWLNDPNGFSWFAGRFHLFYQHNPHDSTWGPMHWGHAVTGDLLGWDHLPLALAPGEAYDADGCFSGGAFADAGRHVVLYTGHVDPAPADPSRRRETQCLAIGDGVTYRKSAANPVIGPDHLPPGASAGDFRDPKLWKEGEDWFCLVASRGADGHGQALLFTAVDPEHWRLVGPALDSGGRLGGMWECPDFFTLGGKDVLLWSVMDQGEEEGRFQNAHAVVWAPGRLNRATGAFTPEGIEELDQGPDFYAPQTVVAPDGRVILVAWMQAWNRSMPTHDLGCGWAGQMTLPREVFWHEGRLAQRPVRELKAWRGREEFRSALVDRPVRFAGIEGQHLDLEVVFQAAQGTTVGTKVFVGDGEETVLSWDSATGWLTLDRSRGGVPIVSRNPSRPQCQVYKARTTANDGVLNLRLVLDRSSLEIFVQNGTTVMSATVYPKAASRAVEFFSIGGTSALECRAWPLSAPAGA